MSIKLNCIKAVCKSRGIKLNWLANNSGITAGTMSAYSMNKSQPKLDKLFIMANYIGCDLKDLINDPKNYNV